jgi:hypothetical protein
MSTYSLRVVMVCLVLLLASAEFGRAQNTSIPVEEVQSDEPEKSYIIPAVEIIGFHVALNRFGYRFEDREAFNVGWNSIGENLRRGWVIDRDEFRVNQFLHPYQGSISHTAARSAGLGFWTSAGYTFAGSALWEIAGETTAPSINDQIASGIGGVFFGESLFRMANLTLEKGNGIPSIGRALGATVISPATAFNRLVFGHRFDPVFPGHDPEFFTRGDIGATVAEYRVEGASRRPRRDEASAGFSMAYGLPGRPDYSYERPFDYFNFEFTATTSNFFENIMTRGMLAGKEYSAGDSYRGIWGLYGSYDYMAPQLFRVSSTALSAGTTAQWRVAGPLRFQGTALAGAGYGAGGTVDGSGSERDYHYGLTPQALLATRVIVGKFASLDITGRGYQITRFASPDNRGFENIGRADASLTVRVFRRHALTAKYVITRRNAHYPDLGSRDQRRGTLSLFYTVLGDQDFGITEWTPTR